MSTYSLYQITCGFDGNQETLETFLFECIDEIFKTSKVVLTVNCVNYGKSIYSGKYPCKGEPVAMIFVSTNPHHCEDAKPHTHTLAEKLREKYDQYVVPYSAVSESTAVDVASKN